MSTAQMMLLGGALRTYATLNPADKSANITLSNGNLTASSSTVAHSLVRATVSKTSGKWYWEMTFTSAQIAVHLGWANSTLPTSNYVGQTTDGWDYGMNVVGATWAFSHNASTAGSGGTAVSSAAGNVLNCAYDADTQKLFFGLDGTYMGSNPVTEATPNWASVTGTLFPAISLFSNDGSSVTATVNFGATAFANTVPSGFNPGVYQ